MNTALPSRDQQEPLASARHQNDANFCWEGVAETPSDHPLSSERNVVVARVGDSVVLSVAIDAKALDLRHVVIPRFAPMLIAWVMHLQRHFAFRTPTTSTLVSVVFQHFTAKFEPARIFQFFLVGHGQCWRAFLLHEIDALKATALELEPAAAGAPIVATGRTRAGNKSERRGLNVTLCGLIVDPCVLKPQGTGET